MIAVMPTAAALLLAVTIEVPAGADLAGALARARPGDVVQLGPGEHHASLGSPAGIRIAVAGAGVTYVLAPEGADGAVARGPLELEGLTIRAGAMRCGLKVLGGSVRLSGAALAGGSCGAFVSGGMLEGRSVDLRGAYGVLLDGGKVALEDGSARGGVAGVGVVGGSISLRRFDVVGPSTEGGISVSGGTARLEAVVVRAPGPTGISVSGGGQVEALDVSVGGAQEREGFLGDCVQVIRGTARLEAGTLVRCAGAAVEASGGDVSLVGTDAEGGAAGCVALVNGARAVLVGNLCAGHGPGLVAGSGAHATTRFGRWWTDPVLWVDCGAGARVEIGRGERTRPPCPSSP